METINKSLAAAAAVASHAVWGTDESKEEPVSGKTGDVSKGEPYDAGNMEPKESTGVTGGDTLKPTELPTRTKQINTGEAVPTDESSTESSAKETIKGTSATTTSAASAPHKAEGSSVSNSDMSKAQQDVRSPSDAQTHPSHAQARSNVDNTATGLDTNDNSTRIDGPGPKPLEEVAKAHGGDAGKAPEDQRDRDGNDDNDEDDGTGIQKKSHGEGTGEKYIKSTGLAADGGNFDASQPGAGREADRLLEEKGVHRDGGAPNISAPSDTNDSKDANGHGYGHTKEKRSLGEKIKAKLHKSSTAA